MMAPSDPKSRPVYLDYQATTPILPEVLDAMMPYLTAQFGNPNSAGHAYGWEAEVPLEHCRTEIKALLNGEAGEVILLSGATEANNLAIKGTMQAKAATRPHMVTVITEHSCVLESARWCKAAGLKVTVLSVNPDGSLDLGALRSAVTPETALVSVMMVNNEIGTIHPMAEIGAIVREKGALFHTDAAQAFGKIPIDVEAMGIDLLSLTAHKLYGPKGVGALWRRDTLNNKPMPQLSGGGQENGWRAGTQAPALVAGLAKATNLASIDMAQEESRLARLSGTFMERLQSAVPEARLNGASDRRWAGNLNVCFQGLRSDLLMSSLKDVAVSTGSACSSGTGEPSRVLTALGLSKEDARSSLRISLGRQTTEDDLNRALSAFAAAADEVRAKMRMGGGL